MADYLFSICVPVYNTEQYLRRALDSIANQAFDPEKIETVVVNDGSPHTKECDQIIAEYSSRLSIQYIAKNTNEGLFLARKTAVEKAAGRYILFLDSDDSLEIHALRILSENLAGEPDYVQFRIYDVIGSEKSLHHSVLEDETHKTMADVLQNKAIHSLVNKCYNTQMLKRVYELIPNAHAVYAEDYYQSAVIEYFSHKKSFIDIPLYNYFRDIGVTSNSTFKNKRKIVQIITGFQTIEQNLVLFFEQNDERQYAQYVKGYIRELHINFAYWAYSLFAIFFILKKLPTEYHALKHKILITFLLHTGKQFVKNLLPYGLVQTILKKKRILNSYESS